MMLAETTNRIPPASGPDVAPFAQIRAILGTIIFLCPPPLDRSRFRDFASRCTPNDLRLRFGGPIRPEVAGDRLCDVNQASIRSLAAFGDDGEIWAVAQIVMSAPGTAEVGIIVRSDHQRLGIGRALIAALARESRNAGVSELRGMVLAENGAMRGLAREMGFVASRQAGVGIEIGLTL
jgi:acetyltransferase